MAEKNEMVSLELSPSMRAVMRRQMSDLMAPKKYPDKLARLGEIAKKEFGIPLKFGWPQRGEVTLAQLVILAQKYHFKIVIGHIDIQPMPIISEAEKEEIKKKLREAYPNCGKGCCSVNAGG